MTVIPSRMGRLNRRALLACLQRLGSASRAELAKESNLSQPTVGKITEELISKGIIEEIGSATSEDASTSTSQGLRPKAGRPGRVLRLNQTRPRFLGIHLDVHETSFALMPVRPQPRDEWNWSAPTSRNRAGWVKTLRKAKSQLNAEDLLGVILCVPGIVDESAGKVLFSPNLHWTESLSLPGLLREVWPLQVVVVQEIRVLALGHSTFDVSDEDFLLVDIGEGVGSAAILGGRPYSNQLPMSGELGHTLVHANARRCGCGATGCLETLLSRRGLLQSFAEASGGGPVDLEQLRQHIACEGLPAWLSETMADAGAIIAGALNVLGIRKVVVTGVFHDLPPEVHQCLAQAITRGSLWERFGTVECLVAPRHHTAGMTAVGIDRLVMATDAGLPMAHVPTRQRQVAG